MTLRDMVRVNIRDWRKQNKLTQTQLAKKVGVNLHTIVKWEKGYTFPNPEYLEAIADICHKPVYLLFFRSSK